MERSAYHEFRDLEDRHWWFLGRKSIFTHLLARLALPKKARVLDLGCGMGGMLAELGALGENFEVHGADVAQEALVHCRSRGFAKTFRAHGQALPYEDASFDLVTAFDTLEHIPQETETLLECQRILKPGGVLFLSVPAYQFLYTHQDRIVHHQRRYTASGLEAKLEMAGFRVLKASYINFFLFPLILPVVLLVKLLQFLSRSKPGNRTNVGVPVALWLNTLLARIFAAERHVLARLSMPIGHSLVVISAKPTTQEE
ncbi:MAG: class I SAM-dependent methyltransferase [Planctomycetes bacterium]|nr:class I SAM-dependent methyltransferase [Planctomycetota bacterium]